MVPYDLEDNVRRTMDLILRFPDRQPRHGLTSKTALGHLAESTTPGLRSAPEFSMASSAWAGMSRGD